MKKEDFDVFYFNFYIYYIQDMFLFISFFLYKKNEVSDM